MESERILSDIPNCAFLSEFAFWGFSFCGRNHKKEEKKPQMKIWHEHLMVRDIPAVRSNNIRLLNIFSSGAYQPCIKAFC